MADIKKITLPSGSTYDLVDQGARDLISNLQNSVTGGMHYIGVTTTTLTDGASTNPVTIGGKSITAVAGDIVIYGDLEFIYSGSDSKWHEFGSTGSLKGLAFADTASGQASLTGTAAAQKFTGKEVKLTSTGKTDGVAVSDITHTPTGDVKFTKGDATTNNSYTPSGSLSGTAVTLNTGTKYVAENATGGGSKTDGSAASWTATVTNEVLTISWTPNVPTEVTLPTFKSATVASGVKSVTNPTFTGDAVAVAFAGTEETLTHSVTQGDVSVEVTYKPEGTNEASTATAGGKVTVSPDVATK